MTLKARIAKLEKANGPKEEEWSIFMATVPSDSTSPTINGWTATTRDGQKITVKAKTGETREALQARTLEMVTPYRTKGEAIIFKAMD